MSVGHSPSQQQHTPDQRKDAKDITEHEMAEAKRRIQGSSQHEEGFDDSDESLPASQTVGASGSA